MSLHEQSRPVRRGLPRRRGGPRWPDAVSSAPVGSRDPDPVARAVAEPPRPATRPVTRLRRGLPRTAGGPAWPSDSLAGAVETLVPAAPAATAAPAAPAATAAPVADPAPPASAVLEADPASERPGAPVPGPSRTPAPRPRLWRAVGGVAAIVVAAGILMLAARGLLTFPWVQDFMRTYPGDVALPAGAPVGFPVWLNWQHFCNAFLMLLIIRSGIQVRREQRPKASWSPRWNPARRISLTLWLHQSLDLLWIVNGVLFVILLFASGQWMRVVPTSWSVFPNAISAALQYASLNWPTDNGWVNYNSLQQLTYFTVVFIAAPLAAVTGVRMSGLWPKNAGRLSRRYPVEVARAVHFPTMVFFVAFIVVHVALVFATGALRNLNHMYAASDSVDWVGFWIFVASAVVMWGGWMAARPLIVAPIASLFGRVGR